MVYLPDEAALLFDNGYGTDEIVRRGVINGEGKPASSRTARRWRQEWLARTGSKTSVEASGLLRDIKDLRRIAASQTSCCDEVEHEREPVFTSQVQVLDSPEQRSAKLREAARMITELMNESDPVTTHYTRVFDTTKPVAIMWASCMHLGGRYTDHDFIERTMNEFADFGHIFFIGDEIEGFSPAWFHSGSIIEQGLQIPLQIELFDSYMERFWDRTIGGCWSQHGSMWFEKNQGTNPLKRRYLDRGIPYFDGSANLTYQVGNQLYYIVASHEFPGNSQWNKNHSHIRALRFNYPTADAIIAGDKHTYAYQEIQVYTDEYEAGRRPSPWVHLIQSGTAKTGPDKYTIKAWSKGQAEWPITVLFPEEHLIKVTRHIDDARKWVEG